MRKISRREFISTTAKVLAAAPFAGTIGTLSPCFASSCPNFLLIMVDQMQTPPEGYSADEGAAQGLKEILGFRPLSPDNQYTQYFPGLLRLRQNSVVMRKHYTASAACVPSRTCIMTGQYSSVTGSDQTDGMFKTASDLPWLDPDGAPTIGDWFRAIGYKTHYFGKWHVSEVEDGGDYLEPFGFSDWEKSYPEPHGGGATNIGVNRDIQFADLVVEFLNERGSDASKVPWFAVGSLLDPHDCCSWPIPWQMPDILVAEGYDTVVKWKDYPPPPPIPSKGEEAQFDHTDLDGNPQPIPLNPGGFPQENSSLPPTYAETLDTKPRCQKECGLKWELGMKALLNSFLKETGKSSAFPFKLQEDPEAWYRAYNQFYFYSLYLADRQICKMLNALDENGLADNTIVVFLSDHGEMTGAHGGMIQKWHNAYEEAVRVPMVISSPLVNKDREQMREISQPTSSIDFAPTMLGLAGLSTKLARSIMKAFYGRENVKPFAGADLSSHVKGERKGPIIGPDGKRNGVFFMTNDMITELAELASEDKQAQYELFLDYIKEMKEIPGYEYLEEGTVVQPNNVRAFCTGDWKIVHYVDPNGLESDEWELYCLKTDPAETTNLVDYSTGQLLEGVTVEGYTEGRLIAKYKVLKKELAKQEAAIIG
ncbi:MAG: sulfatase-like hydrolase/transferase [Desulfobacteria bacterium]